jgi:hypothetical protein
MEEWFLELVTFCSARHFAESTVGLPSCTEQDWAGSPKERLSTTLDLLLSAGS